MQGYPDVALTPNGAERSVCLGNLGEYVQLVVDATVGSGVTSQVLQVSDGLRQDDTISQPYILHLSTMLSHFGSPTFIVKLIGSCILPLKSEAKFCKPKIVVKLL
eukprot:SAG11_NODE_857_length_6851_cov_2.438981_7_plen_105_part_00